ncbi:transposase [Escherichia coli]|uniref:Mobile element protein n=1 Tax=Escherichia coli TaxID=562 RepID=A0A288XGJ1_ECOLX|nr:Mobile element protein [Escherichia coli]KDW71738.1 HTH-like domain protein [Escherichia coli 1-392-07_S1_C1]KDW78574.1 HTH-like domain protein [Escherichia coli 1-392-07_S1_C2]KDY13975.1 HTH-like domain protein [Escherichia coli 2-316-03_S4_C3]KEJ19539.1 HTH-like domain protein [Escherichia coli 6-175-07_S1_C2]KEJ57869.1 HTH-like domain protein [Escherichia coli 3-020-07_S4_C1]
MKYVFIEKHQAEFSIKAMCRVLRVARSGWYTWCQRRTRISTRQQFRQHCDSVVLAAFTRSKQRYGAPRLTDELRAQGYPFNVKTVAASLRRQGLRAKASRKFSPVSYRAHGLPVSENLLEQDFYASGPNQKWAGVWKYRGKSKQQLTIAIIISIIFFVLIYHLIL